MLGKNPWRVAVDELVQIGRVSADGDRSHPQVTTALREQFEDSAADRVKIFVRVIRFAISHIGYYLLYIVDATIKLSLMFSMKTLTAQFQARVEEFLRRTGFKETEFWRQAVSDPTLLLDLRRGRSAQAGDGRPDSGLHRSLRAGSAGTGFRSQESRYWIFPQWRMKQI